MYEIKQERGYYILCKNGKFVSSADTYNEAEQELLNDYNKVNKRRIEK